MSAQTVTIATLGWNERDQTVLKSLVSIIRKSTDREWIWTESPDPDVIVIDIDHDTGRQAWSTRSAASRLTVAYTSRATRFDARFRLDKPLRGRGVLDLLRALARALDADTDDRPAPTGTVAAPRPVGSTPFSVLDVIASTRGDAAMLFALAPTVRFIIDWPRERFFDLSGSGDLTGILGADPGRLTHKPITPDELRRLTAARIPMSLHRFLWHGLHSAGKLELRGRHRLSRQQTLRLTHWPDFGSIPHTYDDVRIASRLVHRGATIGDLASIGAKAGSVAAFLSAATRIGIVSQGGPEQPDADRRCGPLSLLRTALKRPGAQRRGDGGALPSSVTTVLFAGPPGTGKTAAINAMSRTRKVLTVEEPDAALAGRRSEAISIEYGEALIEGRCFHLLKAPGQGRYSWAWDRLGRDAGAIVLLSDNSRPRPLASLSIYLDHLSPYLNGTPLVIGVTRADTPDSPSLPEYRRFLLDRGKRLPVISVDPTEGRSVATLLDILRACCELAQKDAA